MIVAVSLGLEDILIDGEGITVVHVAELGDELVHDAVVPELLLINHISLLLDDIIETDTVRQLELVVVFEPINPHSLLLDHSGVSGGKSGVLRLCRCCTTGLLIVDLLNGRSELFLSQMGEKTTGHKSVALTALCDRVVSEFLERIAKLILLEFFVSGQGKGTIGVLWCRVDLVDQVRLVLIRSHVGLILVILLLSSVEISCKVHRGRVEEKRGASLI